MFLWKQTRCWQVSTKTRLGMHNSMFRRAQQDVWRNVEDIHLYRYGGILICVVVMFVFKSHDYDSCFPKDGFQIPSVEKNTQYYDKRNIETNNNRQNTIKWMKNPAKINRKVRCATNICSLFSNYENYALLFIQSLNI